MDSKGCYVVKLFKRKRPCIGDAYRNGADELPPNVNEGALQRKKKSLPVVMRLWETPVPIPNTTVKT